MEAPLSIGDGSADALRTRFPLTEPQLEIWLASQLNEDASRAVHISGFLDLRGALNRGALTDSIRLLGERHEALRVTVRFRREAKAH